MKAILDTQALIWFSAGDSRMPSRVRKFIEAEHNDLVLSMITPWEITIKAGLGRLDIGASVSNFLFEWIGRLLLIPLAISFEHILELAELPPIHGDPFDRLLIAQARHERLPLITNDSAIMQYDVETIW